MEQSFQSNNVSKVSPGKTRESIETLEEIHLQSRLFALAAATEAARAGKSGDEFILAAEEIKNLVERRLADSRG